MEWRVFTQKRRQQYGEGGEGALLRRYRGYIISSFGNGTLSGWIIKVECNLLNVRIESNLIRKTAEVKMCILELPNPRVRVVAKRNTSKNPSLTTVQILKL
jgi:hypothetical protein